jgi:FkbM family methyltransferase
MYDRFNWTSGSFRRNRLTEEYEPLQPFFFVALAKCAACRTFIDVGANIGAYSLFGTLVPTVDHVIAFEADYATVEELKRNVRLNNLEERIEVHLNAVSDMIGTLTFGSMGPLSGANSVVSTSIHHRTKFRARNTVDATTLDETFGAAALGPIAIKIDVEGHEAAVLDGGKSMLRTSPVIMQIECYEGDGEEIKGRLHDIGLKQVTAIGPDHYFTNIESLQVPSAIIETYERSAQDMISYYHRSKAATVEVGDFKLEVVGKSADLARRLKRLLLR